MISKKTLGISVMVFAVFLLVSLSFLKADIEQQGVFLCKAVEADPELSMEDCPAHQGGTSWLITLSFALALLILAVGGYLTFAPVKVEKKPKKLPKLSGDEKKIYNIIKEHDGSIYQSELIKQSEFSKVKVTRILDGLEGKHVLERKRRGMTNVIILK